VIDASQIKSGDSLWEHSFRKEKETASKKQLFPGEIDGLSFGIVCKFL